MKLERITKNIAIDPDTQCWNWIKSCSSSGYGQLTEDGKYWNTHIYSWVLHKGSLPADHLVITRNVATLFTLSLVLIKTTGKIQKKFTQESQPNVEPCGLCMVKIIKPVVKQ